MVITKNNDTKSSRSGHVRVKCTTARKPVYRRTRQRCPFLGRRYMIGYLKNFNNIRTAAVAVRVLTIYTRVNYDVT